MCQITAKSIYVTITTMANVGQCDSLTSVIPLRSFQVFNFICQRQFETNIFFFFNLQRKMSNQSGNSVKRKLIDDGNSEMDKKLDKSIHLLRICNEFEGELGNFANSGIVYISE